MNDLGEFLLLAAAVMALLVGAHLGWWWLAGCIVAGVLIGIRDRLRDKRLLREVGVRDVS